MAKAKGMAAKSPTAQPAGQAEPAKVNPRTGRPYKYSLKQLEARQAAGMQLGPRQIARLQKAGRIAPSTATPTTQLTPQQLEQRVGSQTGAGVGQFMDIIGQQGAFRPGSFQQQMDAAYQNVLNQYQQTMAPELAREQADFQQMAAERGLDPNSEAYKTLQSQLNQRQDLARQSAMQNALQASQQVQAQGFNQALQGYQAPAQMLQAFTPYYNVFGERMTQKEQEQYLRDKMAQDAALEQQRISAGITQARIGQFGELTPEQQFEMLRQQQAHQIAMAYLPGLDKPTPSTGSQIASGLGMAAGSAIGSWLGGK